MTEIITLIEMHLFDLLWTFGTILVVLYGLKQIGKIIGYILKNKGKKKNDLKIPFNSLNEMFSSVSTGLRTQINQLEAELTKQGKPFEEDEGWKMLTGQLKTAEKALGYLSNDVIGIIDSVAFPYIKDSLPSIFGAGKKIFKSLI